jgi:hypothetical protein
MRVLLAAVVLLLCCIKNRRWGRAAGSSRAEELRKKKSRGIEESTGPAGAEEITGWSRRMEEALGWRRGGAPSGGEAARRVEERRRGTAGKAAQLYSRAKCKP